MELPHDYKKLINISEMDPYIGQKMLITTNNQLLQCLMVKMNDSTNTNQQYYNKY